MAAPEYDFFATGPRSKPAGQTTDRFGMPSAPQPPLQQSYAPEAPAVNQFGLPVEEARPTGPLAAPGYGAVPVHNSLAAGYDDAPAVWDPAAAMAARPHRRALPPRADARPGSVLAAGIVSIALGVLGVLAAGVILLGYLGAKGEVDSALAAAGADAAGMEGMAAAFLTAILVSGLVVAAMSALYIALGALVIAGRRWAGWTLVVLTGLSVLGSLWQIVNGSSSGIGTWIAIGASLSVLLLLTVGEGGRWLRRS
ncbi:MAG: hypothetical protein AB7O74_07945 [Candidatus Nanopelagicales bacterium]